VRGKGGEAGVVLQANDFLQEYPNAEHFGENLPDVLLGVANGAVVVLADDFEYGTASTLQFGARTDVNALAGERGFEFKDELLQIRERGDLAGFPEGFWHLGFGVCHIRGFP